MCIEGGFSRLLFFSFSSITRFLEIPSNSGSFLFSCSTKGKRKRNSPIFWSGRVDLFASRRKVVYLADTQPSVIPRNRGTPPRPYRSIRHRWRGTSVLSSNNQPSPEPDIEPSDRHFSPFSVYGSFRSQNDCLWKYGKELELEFSRFYFFEFSRDRRNDYFYFSSSSGEDTGEKNRCFEKYHRKG